MNLENKNTTAKIPIVKTYDDTAPLSCPYGKVRRIVTEGEGGIANVHVVCVTKGEAHLHRAYDEIYYILSGTGILEMDSIQYHIRPGSVVVIPAGTVHAVTSENDTPLEFIIFGTPPLSLKDESAVPLKPREISKQNSTNI